MHKKPVRFRPPRRRVFRKFPVWLPVVLVFIILGAGGLLLWRNYYQSDWKTYQSDELGIMLGWPDSFQQVALTSVDEEAGVVFKIERTEPEAQVFLRYEDGLGPVRFTGKTILEYLKESINRQYPNRFPDYRKEAYREFVFVGQDAAEFIFTYRRGEQGVRIRQRYIVVVKEETAYFLSYQAPEAEFPKSDEDFERIVNSFEFVD